MHLQIKPFFKLIDNFFLLVYYKNFSKFVNCRPNVFNFFKEKSYTLPAFLLKQTPLKKILYLYLLYF